MGNILLLGLVSFFSDISSEMVYPLIPLYLTAVLGATPALVGVIEGIVESLASLLKVFSGYLTDHYRHKKPLAFSGYAAGVIYKLALILASSWAGVLAARVVDRIGKGVRTAPRDVLVAESAEKEHMGKAFGIHKALDMAGSAVGIFLSYLLLTGIAGSCSYPTIFWLSIIPALCGLGLMLLVKEKKVVRVNKKREPFWQNLHSLDRNLKLYLLVSLLFTLGNSSNTFLLLRAKDIGFTDTSVILLYLAYNLTAALLAVPFGRLSDRVGRKKVLVAAYVVFAAVYFAFALVSSASLMVAVFVCYGFFTALNTGAERAMIVEIAPPALKGTMLGLQATIVGLALFPASVIAGLLWDAFGAPAPFFFGGSLSLAAALVLFFLLNRGG